MKMPNKFIFGLLVGLVVGVAISMIFFLAHLRKIDSAPIEPGELQLTIEKIRGEDFLCASAEPKNWFADAQLPAFRVQSNSITIGFYWQRLLPIPVGIVHQNWPLLIGPLDTNWDGNAVFVEGGTSPVAHLRKLETWSIVK